MFDISLTTPACGLIDSHLQFANRSLGNLNTTVVGDTHGLRFGCQVASGRCELVILAKRVLVSRRNQAGFPEE